MHTCMCTHTCRCVSAPRQHTVFLLHHSPCGHLKNTFVCLLERGRKGREGGKHHRMREIPIGCLSHAPNLRPGLQPRVCRTALHATEDSGQGCWGHFPRLCTCVGVDARNFRAWFSVKNLNQSLLIVQYFALTISEALAILAP